MLHCEVKSLYNGVDDVSSLAIYAAGDNALAELEVLLNSFTTRHAIYEPAVKSI